MHVVQESAVNFMRRHRKMAAVEDVVLFYQLAAMMRCTKLKLNQRVNSKSRRRLCQGKDQRPMRYCRMKMVDPRQEEDPRWKDRLIERFRCNIDDDISIGSPRHGDEKFNNDCENLFLTVQNLKFPETAKEPAHRRVSFKLKALAKGETHRMFIKEPIDSQVETSRNCPTPTDYYFDDYVNYILESSRSTPTSDTEQNIEIDKIIKPIQLDNKNHKFRKGNKTTKNTVKNKQKQDNANDREATDSIKDAKITFQRKGKRKCLTISRAQSPETVQVIRVDVVCNSIHRRSSDTELAKNTPTHAGEHDRDKEKCNLDIMNTYFGKKYLLTKSVKKLDENVSGGAKVTLLCKTFRLADRHSTMN